MRARRLSERMGSGGPHDTVAERDCRTSYSGFWFPTTHIEKNCEPPP